jgi:hypothetical protein
MTKALSHLRSKVNPSSKVCFSTAGDVNGYANIGKTESASPALDDMRSGCYRVINNVDDVR